MNLKEHSKPFSFSSSSNIGILVIHGFTSSTSSMKFLADGFAKAGYNVELPCLPGHGTSWQDLEKTTYHDWLKHLENTLSKLLKRCDKVFLCGLSMGGGLALRLAELHPDISGLILINHACKFTHPKFWFVPFIKKFIRSVAEIKSDIKCGVVENGYDRTPTKGVHQMLLLLKKVRKDLNKITQPALMYKSKEDHVIPITSTTYTYKNIASQDKELVWLYNSYHVATLDHDKKIILEKSLEFIKAH